MLMSRNSWLTSFGLWFTARMSSSNPLLSGASSLRPTHWSPVYWKIFTLTREKPLCRSWSTYNFSKLTFGSNQRLQRAAYLKNSANVSHKKSSWLPRIGSVSTTSQASQGYKPTLPRTYSSLESRFWKTKKLEKLTGLTLNFWKKTQP